ADEQEVEVELEGIEIERESSSLSRFGIGSSDAPVLDAVVIDDSENSGTEGDQGASHRDILVAMLEHGSPQMRARAQGRLRDLDVTELEINRMADRLGVAA